MSGNYELERAKMEAARNEAEFKYFEARPQIDTTDRHRVFQAGFERAWEAAKKEGSNVIYATTNEQTDAAYIENSRATP